MSGYRKVPKYSDTRKICYNPPKVRTKWFYHRVKRPKDAHGMANSVDPDQTAPLGANSVDPDQTAPLGAV